MRPRFTDVLVRDFANCTTRRRLFTAFYCGGLFKRFFSLSADTWCLALMAAWWPTWKQANAKLRIRLRSGGWLSNV